MAEYGVSLQAAIWEFPLVAAVALLPIRNQRVTGKSQGPTSAQKALIAARNKARAFLRENFHVVDKPVETVGWQLGTRAAPTLSP